MAAFFKLAILDSTILVFPLILTHTCQEWFPPFAQKNLLTVASPPFAQKNFTHSFWLKLMMAAILNSAMLNSDTAILNSDTLLSSLRFTQKHSHSNLTLNQTNSIWLKLIPSHVTWCWQPSWILLSWIQLFHTKKLHLLILTQLDDGIHLEFYHLEFCHLGFNHFVQNSDWN